MASPAPHPEQHVQFWESRYQDGSDRWDLGQPAPPFMTLLNDETALPPGRLIALGAGRGYDALLFAEHGFDVVGVDFAPSAIAAAQSLARARHLAAEFIQRNIFELVSPPPKFPESDLEQVNPEQINLGQFDYVLEHTCFCAIAPHQRPAYVELVHRLLRPGGELIGLFWAHNRPGGPPYGSRLEEIEALFSPKFELTCLERVTNSVAARHPDEYLGRFRKRN